MTETRHDQLVWWTAAAQRNDERVLRIARDAAQHDIDRLRLVSAFAASQGCWDCAALALLGWLVGEA